MLFRSIAIASSEFRIKAVSALALVAVAGLLAWLAMGGAFIWDNGSPSASTRLGGLRGLGQSGLTHRSPAVLSVTQTVFWLETR